MTETETDSVYTLLLISKEEPLLTQKGQATEIQTKEYYDTLCSNLQGYTVFVKVKFSIDV